MAFFYSAFIAKDAGIKQSIHCKNWPTCCWFYLKAFNIFIGLEDLTYWEKVAVFMLPIFALFLYIAILAKKRADRIRMEKEALEAANAETVLDGFSEIEWTYQDCSYHSDCDLSLTKLTSSTSTQTDPPSIPKKQRPANLFKIPEGPKWRV